jgi:hypothetical protein
VRIFIALKNPSPWPSLNPLTLNPIASTLTITPPRRFWAFHTPYSKTFFVFKIRSLEQWRATATGKIWVPQYPTGLNSWKLKETKEKKTVKAKVPCYKTPFHSYETIQPPFCVKRTR